MAERQEFTGPEWLERFLKAQGEVAFQSLWMTFAIGQAGAVMGIAKADPGHVEAARAMVAAMEMDRRDLHAAMLKLDGVCLDMIANAKRNLRGLGDA